MQVSLLQNTGLQQQCAVMHVSVTNASDLCLHSVLVIHFLLPLYFLHQSAADREIIDGWIISKVGEKADFL